MSFDSVGWHRRRLAIIFLFIFSDCAHGTEMPSVCVWNLVEAPALARYERARCLSFRALALSALIVLTHLIKKCSSIFLGTTKLSSNDVVGSCCWHWTGVEGSSRCGVTTYGCYESFLKCHWPKAWHSFIFHLESSLMRQEYSAVP